MPDHSTNSLQAVIKSLSDIVGPAVDPADPLGQQQLALSVAYLGFLHSRLPHLSARDRNELAHQVRLGGSVLDALRDHISDGGLQDAVSKGHRLLDGDVSPHAGSGRASAVIAARVNELLEGDLPTAVRSAVERAWYAPMGFDPDPGSIAPLDELLACAVPATPRSSSTTASHA